MQHPWQRDVVRVRRATGHALDAIDALARLSYLNEFGTRAVRREIASLNDRQRLEDLTFELVAALDDSDAGHYLLRLAADIPAFTMFT
jgi:hypothetical protein